MTTNKESARYSIEEFSQISAEEAREASIQALIVGVESAQTTADTLQTLAQRQSVWITILTALLVLSMIGAYIGLTKETKFRYFLIDGRGQTHATTPFGVPLLDDATVADFADRAMTALHTFTYLNHNKNFNSYIDTYCNQYAIKSYYTKLTQQNVFVTAEQFKQRYEAVATSVTVVQKFPETGQTEQWRVEGTVREEIIGIGDPTVNTFKVSMVLQRASLQQAHQGILCIQVDENYAK